MTKNHLNKEKKLLESCKYAIKDYGIQLQNAERNLKELGEDTGSITQVEETEWLHISTFLEDICGNVQEKAREELIRRLEDRANEFYKKFTEHDNGYKGRVEIDDNYTIEFDGGLNTSHEDRKKMSIMHYYP